MKRIDDIREYLHGNRKGEAANRLEREALSDPFLYEALEGLTSTPGDPIDGLIRLERQLNERARSSRKKKKAWLYVAASIAVLLVCGTLWFTGQEKELASPVMEISQLSPSDTRYGEKAVLTLSSGKATTLGTDTLTALSEEETVEQPVAREEAKKEIVRELRIESAADQALPLSSVKARDTSLMRARKIAAPGSHVEGTVTDEKGNPLPGVTVILAGTTFGVSSDVNGNFSLEIPLSGGNLLFSFVGMKSQAVSVKAGDRLQVQMKEDSDQSRDVTVTGYRHVERKEKVIDVKLQGQALGLGKQVAAIDTIASKEDIARFNRYMEEALRYPKKDLEAGNSGTIRLSFELNRRNVPSRIQIHDGFSKESNNEMIRLLSGGPKWETSVTGKRIHVFVRFVIGKDGEKHKAILAVEHPRE